MKKILCTFLILLYLCGCTVPAESTEPALTEPVASELPTVAVTEPVEESEPTIADETTAVLDLAPGAYQEKFYDEIEDQYMDYYLFIPENATVNMPLIIFLHGDGEVNKVYKLENNSFMTNIWEIYGENYPFISIAPCTRMETWYEFYVPYTLKNLIDYIVEAYEIDREHIIITGHSRGATGVWNMINTHGDFFSAAVPVSCHCWNRFKMENILQVPIRAFCGNVEDFECNYMNQLANQIAEIQLAGGDAELTVLDNYRHAQTPVGAYTKELIKWMLEQ